jgi:hypothetical protein
MAERNAVVLFEPDLIRIIPLMGIKYRSKLLDVSSVCNDIFSLKCPFPIIQLSIIKVPFQSAFNWYMSSSQLFCFLFTRDLSVILQITFYLYYKGFPFRCPSTSPFLLPMPPLLLHSIFLSTCFLHVATQPPGVRRLHFILWRATFPLVTQTLAH